MKNKIKILKESIIHVNKEFIALNKPINIATQRGNKDSFDIESALPYLKIEPSDVLKLVHRLDKATSGILLIARNKQSAEKITDLFKARRIEKIYLAKVRNVPTKKEYSINLPLIKKFQGNNEKVLVDYKIGKEAITNYKVLSCENKENQKTSLLELKPLTGRTHQLRVHLKVIGHSIIGDGKYGGSKSMIGNFSNRLNLHAFIIKINFLQKEPLIIKNKLPNFLTMKEKKIIKELYDI